MEEEVIIDFISAVAHLRRLQREKQATTPLGQHVLKSAEERVDELLDELTCENEK